MFSKVESTPGTVPKPSTKDLASTTCRARRGDGCAANPAAPVPQAIRRAVQSSPHTQQVGAV